MPGETDFAAEFREGLERMDPHGIGRHGEPRQIGKDRGHLAGFERLRGLGERLAAELDIQFPFAARGDLFEAALEKGVAALDGERERLE